MRDLRNAFTDVGMTMNEYDVMFIVHGADGHRLRMRDLNACVLITQSSVSRLVDRLAERGLMAKHDDALDARGTVVSLTEQGLAAFRNAHAVHQGNIESRLSSELNTDELRTLTELSQRLVAATAK